MTMTTNPFEFHPLANMFPLMEGKEFDALVADIKANGLREKITLYQGKVLDGRNRYRASVKAGVESQFEQFEGDEAAATAFVISKNICRRHLSAGRKRELIAKLLKVSPEKSDRQIGKMAKADNKTVATIRAGLEGREEIPHISNRIDTKGRKQLSRRSPLPSLHRAAKLGEKTVAKIKGTSLDNAREMDGQTNACLSRKKRREIMRVEVEHLAMRLAERAADIARELHDILWADDRNAEPLVTALALALGIAEESDAEMPGQHIAA
jgi:hypothetical protein